MRRRGPGIGGFVPLAVVLLVAGALPFASAVGDSFFHDVFGERSFAGLANYLFLAGDRAFALSALITLAWAAASTAICVGAGFALATLLCESGRASRIAYLALLVPWGVPAFIGIPLWRMLFHGSGGDSIIATLFGIRVDLMTDPLGSFAAAVFVNGWMSAPLAAFAAYASLRKVPRAEVEAARLDGAGKAALAFRIYFPHAGGALLAIGALEFVKAFKEFNLPFLFTAGGPPLMAGITDRAVVGATTTLEIYLYDLFQASDDYGLAAAYATVLAAATALLVAVSLFVSRAAAARRSSREPTSAEAEATAAVNGAAAVDIGAAARDGRAMGGIPLPLPRRRRPPGAVADALWIAFRVALAALFAVSALLLAYALLWIAFSALPSNYVDSLVPRFRTAQNFIRIFTEDGLARPFLNTLLVSLAAALLTPLLVLPAARALSGAGTGLKAAAFAIAQALGAAGGMHSLVPLYAMARAAGLLDTYVPLLLVNLFHAAPFALFTTTAFLERLSRSAEEAAELDGASPATRLFRITLPLAMPSLAAGAMAAFLSAWNSFLAPLVLLNDDSMFTIGVRLYSYVGSVASGSPKWNRFAAASVVNLVAIGVIMLRARGPLGSDAAAHQDD